MSLQGLLMLWCLYTMVGCGRILWAMWRHGTEDVVVWYAKLRWMPDTTDEMNDWLELLFLVSIWPLWLKTEAFDDGEV